MQAEKQAEKRASVKLPWTWVMGLFLVLGMSGDVFADESETSAREAIAPPGTIGFVGKNLIANAQGIFHGWSVIEHAIDLSSLESSYVVVEVDLSSIDTKNESRDEHLRTADFFDVEKYPTATARGYGLKSLGDSEAGHPRYGVSFDIDLHGVSKTVEGEVELIGRAPIVVEGALEIDRVDFGIGKPASRWNPMSIKEIIPIHFRVEL